LAFGGGHLWVSNEAGNSVTEINPSNGSWIATFQSNLYGFDRPTAITSYGPDIFVANETGSVSELSAADGALVRIIAGPSYRFVHPVALQVADSTLLVLNAGRSAGSSPVGGSITEIDPATGSFLRNVSGSSYAFEDPAAFAASGHEVFVADERANAVTEVRISNGALIRVVRGQGLSAPDGIGVASGRVWVADRATSAATEIAAASGRVLATDTDSDADYGFWTPSTVLASGASIFIATPFGTSPMVTKLSATTGRPSWYMCNTNGPYYFSLLSAFAVSGSHLWVASRSGANSKTPGAVTGSLTELSTGDGSLIMTLPTASTTSPTTSTTTSTTTTTTGP
jgi:hypothetical protein